MKVDSPPHTSRGGDIMANPKQESESDPTVFIYIAMAIVVGFILYFGDIRQDGFTTPYDDEIAESILD
jgi:hypothetical protein